MAVKEPKHDCTTMVTPIAPAAHGVESQWAGAWVAPLSLPRLYLCLFTSRVQAGFPSPADDYIEAGLDLNHHLVQHPVATP